jgi:hypothetical protein
VRIWLKHANTCREGEETSNRDISAFSIKNPFDHFIASEDTVSTGGRFYHRGIRHDFSKLDGRMLCDYGLTQIRVGLSMFGILTKEK